MKTYQLSNKKLLLITIGIGALIGQSITMYITWLHAWFNGMHTRVCINNYGEANFEFIFVPVVTIIGIYSCYVLLGSYIKKDRSQI